MKKRVFTIVVLLVMTISASAAELWLEAENFTVKGGWCVDQQFMDLMGSPYLLAHGMGHAVKPASTKVVFTEKGTYFAYVRTYNWTSPWKEGEGPGKFKLAVGEKKFKQILGAEGNCWEWQLAGKIKIKKLNQTVKLIDLTGFEGRCDAIYFTTEENYVPPANVKDLEIFRHHIKNMPDTPRLAGKYDLVVIGGGVAGISASVSAARLGCKVALIHDRPILGGNNSSEVRVHLGGRNNIGKYKSLGNLQNEFGSERGGNAQPKAFYADEKKSVIIANEPNITLFDNFHAMGVDMDGNCIHFVHARHIETGEELIFEAPLFADCTGDGTIGYLAGADYSVGRESREEFNEETAPVIADKMTMGASVQWYSVKKDKPVSFPEFNYGVNFNASNCEEVTTGEWTWETGMNYDQIKDFERIRDYGLLVVYSNWSYLKNKYKKNSTFRNRALQWVAYISGKRESRRLLGDYILKEDDIRRYDVQEDGTACTTWTIDLHYPEPENSKKFPNNEFKSICKQTEIYPYPIPYRCLYSRNVNNLFMAGRNISVTHVALGTVRVMRTTGMMGEVVGMAASLCNKHRVKPQAIYRYHLPELKALMNKGVGKAGFPNNQNYNKGRTLKDKPIVR